MNRFRWPLTASVLVIALVVGIWLYFFNGPPEKCKPVIEMLDFNRSQGALISDKAPDQANPLPTVAEDVVYHQWADGLAERAATRAVGSAVVVGFGSYAAFFSGALSVTAKILDE